MSRKFLVPIDMAKNQILNLVFENLAAAPGSPVAGQTYYDTVLGLWFYRNGSAWIDPLARANHTGSQLAATISNFDTQVRTSRLDQMAAPTGSVSLNSQKIVNLADGTSAQDAATYGQLQNFANNTDWKASVRIASTANLALTGLSAIDGITPVAGDRVLVKNNTTASQNGIYTAAAGAWTRATDADTSAKVTAGLSVMVTEGTVNADTQWRLTTDDAIVLNTTALTFTQIGAGTSYVQGTGIIISGNTVSIDPAVVTRKFAQDVGDGSSVSIAVTHGLNTLDAMVQVYQKSDGAQVECDVIRNSVNQVTLGFAVAPASNALRIVVQA